MRFSHEVWYDGPYLHISLPDAAPPDWESIRVELDDDAYVSRVFVKAPAWMRPEDEAELTVICGSLEADGARIALMRPHEFAEGYFG